MKQFQNYHPNLFTQKNIETPLEWTSHHPLDTEHFLESYVTFDSRGGKGHSTVRNVERTGCAEECEDDIFSAVVIC